MVLIKTTTVWEGDSSSTFQDSFESNSIQVQWIEYRLAFYCTGYQEGRGHGLEAIIMIIENKKPCPDLRLYLGEPQCSTCSTCTCRRVRHCRVGVWASTSSPRATYPRATASGTLYCGGYRHLGRAASYSPGRPWSLDGARSRTRFTKSNANRRSSPFRLPPSLFRGKKTRGAASGPDLNFREARNFVFFRLWDSPALRVRKVGTSTT